MVDAQDKRYPGVGLLIVFSTGGAFWFTVFAAVSHFMH
jgi:hypothetical protein